MGVGQCARALGRLGDPEHVPAGAASVNVATVGVSEGSAASVPYGLADVAGGEGEVAAAAVALDGPVEVAGEQGKVSGDLEWPPAGRLIESVGGGEAELGRPVGGVEVPALPGAAPRRRVGGRQPRRARASQRRRRPLGPTEDLRLGSPEPEEVQRGDQAQSPVVAVAEEAVERGTEVVEVEVEAGRHTASSVPSRPCSASRHSRSAQSPCAADTSSSSWVRRSCSTANSRTESSIVYRLPDGVALQRSSEPSTSASTVGGTRVRSSPVAVRSSPAAPRSKEPRNTPSRRNTVRSTGARSSCDQSIMAASER